MYKIFYDNQYMFTYSYIPKELSSKCSNYKTLGGYTYINSNYSLKVNK